MIPDTLNTAAAHRRSHAIEAVPLTAYHARQLTAKHLGGGGGSNGHDFQQQLMPQDNTNVGCRQPKLSKGGQYYLDCARCRRTVFEDGTGSASLSSCDHYAAG